MPPLATGNPYQLGPKRWGLRYVDRDGHRARTKEKFTSRSAALRHYRDVIEPMLRGEAPAPAETTLAAFVPVYLDRHTGVRQRTIDTLRERLAYATATFGDVPLHDLEGMTDEIAAWHATLPTGSRYGVMQALRQCLAAAARWQRMTTNPAALAGRNPQPPPRPIRVYELAELDAIAAEMSAAYRSLPAFAAATGLRPEEWAALERRDIDRRTRKLAVRRTVTGGKTAGSPLELVELAKTSRSRREVPLSARALAALDAIPARLDTALLFPAAGGGPLRLDNFRRRQWGPAIEAAGIDRPARIYDTRSTFASNAIAAGIDVFELARIMGTSIQMIERHYGTLLSGAAAGIAARLDAFEASRDRASNQATDDQT